MRCGPALFPEYRSFNMRRFWENQQGHHGALIIYTDFVRNQPCQRRTETLPHALPIQILQKIDKTGLAGFDLQAKPL